MNTMIIFIIAAALITLGILLTGVFTMASGKDITGRRSNKLMWWRVAAQATTLVLIVVFVALAASG